MTTLEIWEMGMPVAAASLPGVQPNLNNLWLTGEEFSGILLREVSRPGRETPWPFSVEGCPPVVLTGGL